MAQDFLSDIELYYTLPELVQDEFLSIKGEECKHIVRVMRHQSGDELFVTSGDGKIYKSEIIALSKSEVECKILHTYNYETSLQNFVICIPRLRSQDRFEFALEKCIELGFTKFIIYTADRSVSKGEKLDRWNKITLSAMKQSLRSYLPEIIYKNSLSEILNDNASIIYFDQNSEKPFYSAIKGLKSNENNYLIFGPEGGFSEKEFSLLQNENDFQLTQNRLRAETAIVTAGSLISNLI